MTSTSRYKGLPILLDLLATAVGKHTETSCLRVHRLAPAILALI